MQKLIDGAGGLDPCCGTGGGGDLNAGTLGVAVPGGGAGPGGALKLAGWLNPV